MESESLLKQAFGLNAYETKVYLALLRKRMSAKEASEASKVPLPRTYDVLKALAQKGFANESGGVFRAVRPSVALQSRMTRLAQEFDQEQSGRDQVRQRIVAELEPVFSPTGKEFEPTMLKGIDAIAAAFIDVLRSSDEVYLLVRKGIEARGTFLSYLWKAAGKDSAIRILIPKAAKVSDSELKVARGSGLEIRRCDDVLLDVMVGGDSVILGVPAHGKDESFGAIAIWVKDDSFAHSIRKSVSQTWKKAARA
jgi:sugar-specific transcriptional regulator TrmB